ncbi:MAG: hypothetical protein WKI04_00925 [Ferruginibacter sp.]
MHKTLSLISIATYQHGDTPDFYQSRKIIETRVIQFGRQSLIRTTLPEVEILKVSQSI